MQKILLLFCLCLLTTSASAAEPIYKIEPYTKTTNGKTSVCGINFTITAGNEPGGFAGSIFIQPSPAGDQIMTAIRINKFKDNSSLLPLDWANIKITNPDRSSFETKDFHHIFNPGDPFGYSAITYDMNSTTLPMSAMMGMTLQTREKDDPTDLEIKVPMIDHADESMSKLTECVFRLKEYVLR